MSYQAARGPRIFFGVIAIGVACFFLFGAASVWLPIVYEKYQYHRLHQCEGRHGIPRSAWTPIFGFDMGGRQLIGDSPEARALIDCIVASQSVERVGARPDGETDMALPKLTIMSFAFSRGLSFTYYPGKSDAAADD